ncbi:MAG: thioesterase domain-containing protein, partial [Chloroflexota bacterium]
VKVRGMRIELGEIEFVLKQHPTVQDAVVIVWKDEQGDNRLAAYLALHQRTETTTSEIREFAQKQLPIYMIPSIFMVLDTLPLNPSGKVNRRALPTPEITRSEVIEFVAPESPLEITMAKIWQDMLGIEQIGITDNFFELGGHSLLAVRLIARIEAETGKKIPLATLFQAPTISQLVGLIDEESEIALTNKAIVALRTQGEQLPLFCMPGNLGNVFTDLQYILKYLATDRPFYAFQDGADVPTKIKDVASYYVNQLREVQPEGPYHIAGICSGGVIAYEMAQQLQAQNQAVELLALIEPSSPSKGTVKSYLQLAARLLPRAMRRFTHHSDNMQELSANEQKDYLRLKMKVLINSWAVKRYIPKRYLGKVDLFLTRDSLNSSTKRQLQWGDFATEGAEVHQIEGTHDTIVGDNDTEIEEKDMRILTEKLNALLSRLSSSS